MRVLITWMSKLGGTEGIARIISGELSERGFEVVAKSVDEVSDLAGFDAVIIGGALYANRWPARLRRFINRNTRALRKVPVWMFSSGPLDDSADRGASTTPLDVAVLSERVGSLGHAMFGGRLEPDAKGFIAGSMAKKSSGDWRNPERIRKWAEQLARELPVAEPGEAIDHPAHSFPRLFAYGVAGWALCGLLMLGLFHVTGLGMASVLRALFAPVIFALFARLYFRARGPREALFTATIWTITALVLDVFVIGFALQHSVAMVGHIGTTWLPLVAIFCVTWLIGTFTALGPLPKRPESPEQRVVPHRA